MNTKLVPVGEEFGKEDAWQLSPKFVYEVMRKLEEKNRNEFGIYEEQIEDIVIALNELGFILLDNDVPHEMPMPKMTTEQGMRYALSESKKALRQIQRCITPDGKYKAVLNDADFLQVAKAIDCIKSYS